MEPQVFAWQPRQRQLVSLLRSLPSVPTRGAEIGVAQGETSAVLLSAFPELRLLMVDAWAVYSKGHPYRKSRDVHSRKSQEEQDRMAAHAETVTAFASDRRTILRTESLTAAEQVPDGSLDFVFLDADHSYEAVLADLTAWFPKIRSGGLLCGHDYGHRLDRSGTWGVQRAVEKFAQERGLPIQVGEATVWWSTAAATPSQPCPTRWISTAVGVIPARLESTRLPRKLLLAETGTPLILHTWEAAHRATSLSRVVVVTDSPEIADVLQRAGADYALSGEQPSGTDRIAEFVEQSSLQESLVVNIQGDEPEIDPSTIDRLVTEMQEYPEAGIGTLATPLKEASQLTNPACVKVVCGDKGQALYFSRAPIPFDRQQKWDLTFSPNPFWLRHIGIYAYRRAILAQWRRWSPSRLERIESLEQLRALERGIRIQVFVTEESHPGIDTRQDYEEFVHRWQSHHCETHAG